MDGIPRVNSNAPTRLTDAVERSMDDLARPTNASSPTRAYLSPPWVAHGTQLLDAHGAVAAQAVHAETAERIAACVNACAGIPIMELQAGILEDLLAACDNAIDEPRLRAILDRVRRR